jgi:hypothetical protein
MYNVCYLICLHSVQILIPSGKRNSFLPDAVWGDAEHSTPLFEKELSNLGPKCLGESTHNGHSQCTG